MKEFYDQRTGEYLGCPECSILKDDKITSSSLKESLSKYILSVSGWRAILVSSGNEDDRSAAVSDEDIVIAGLAAAAFYQSLKKEGAKILLGRDARPTGRVLSEAALRALSGCGASVSFIATSAAPEIMAYSNDGFDGFFYISASHNPIGHNGYKFGSNGGVFNSDEVGAVEALFRSLLSDDSAVSDIISFLEYSDKEESILSESFNAKTEALSYYKSFALSTAGKALERIPEIGIVAELNGSARSASIDMSFLREHGAKVYALNNVPGQVVHPIVPEGENLELCRRTLEDVHKADSSYILGYVPDNDGDRGNLVYYSEKNGRAEILKAQQVFALIAMIETAHQALSGNERIAIAVNGCTSYLADSAVSPFNASVFRSDIGEANVVGLAEDLREKGYSVKIAGEGSNGGIIEYPSKVRDPMNSLMSLLKIYYMPGLYDAIRNAFNIDQERPSLEAIINALPEYTTTSAFSSDGVMHIDVGNFDDFKKRFEELFIKEAPEMMKMHGFSSYRAFQMEGRSGEEGMGEAHRRIPSSGGYRIEFFDSFGRAAFLWFSKSRTEALIRVMADVKGDNKVLHDELLSWHRALIKKAVDIK